MPRSLDAREPARQGAAINAAAEHLRAGGLVAFPTETVYGLGARARDAAAVARVYALKGRPPNHPLIVHLADASAMSAWAAEVPEAARRLAAAYWPGPLTVVLRARDDVPASVTGGAATVALRVPDHPVAMALLLALGEGVAAPSANRFGRVSPTSAAHVLQEFERDADLLVLDGGPCAVGLESTIVDLSSGAPRLLRPGGVGVRALIDAVGPLAGAEAGPRPPAPGDQLRHYAPDVPTRLVERAELTEVPFEVAVLARRAPPPERPVGAAPWLDLGRAPAAYARALYAALRVLEASQPSAIWIERVPDTEPWRAVVDRLQRASGDAASALQAAGAASTSATPRRQGARPEETA